MRADLPAIISAIDAAYQRYAIDRPSPVLVK
jgi:hypothetical protein